MNSSKELRVSCLATFYEQYKLLACVSVRLRGRLVGMRAQLGIRQSCLRLAVPDFVGPYFAQRLHELAAHFGVHVPQVSQDHRC